MATDEGTTMLTCDNPSYQLQLQPLMLPLSINSISKKTTTFKQVFHCHYKNQDVKKETKFVPCVFSFHCY